MKNQDLCWMSAYDLANDIKKKKISPVELVRELLERINAVNPKINAYVTVVADSAMKAAKEAEDAVTRGKEIGPLHGIPFAVKDLTFTKGVRTTMGSKLMEDFVPEEDAVHVSRLKKAGAILLGKTNTPEFGSKAVTDNVVFGITRNPWNTEKTAGGSSGGSAAAVATGMGPLATGSDGGGSIPSTCELLWSFWHQASIWACANLPSLSAIGTYESRRGDNPDSKRRGTYVGRHGRSPLG